MTDTSSTPAERLEELTALYERHAYVVWNVALRTALTQGGAMAAARRAFLEQVGVPNEERLPLDAARIAVEEAGAGDARGVEDPVLAATAHLSPVKRAALALDALAEARAGLVAAALGIEPTRQQELREGAYQELCALLGVSPAEAERAYEDLPWTDPVADLWSALYPELHAAVTRHARAGGVEAAPAARPAGTFTGAPRRLRRAGFVAVSVLAAAGVAWAAGGSDGGAEPSEERSAIGGSSGGSAYSTYAGSGGQAADGETDSGEPAQGKPATSGLTPEELDRLRQREIDQLKRFTRRKQNKRLPQAERHDAARKVSDLVKLARQRQEAAEKRELALRRALAREREARIRAQNRQQQDAERSQPAERGRTQPLPEPQRPEPEQETGRKDGGRTRGEAEAECLYNPDAGTYICPE